MTVSPGRRRARGSSSAARRPPAGTAPAPIDAVQPLILDLLEWIGPHPRPYAEVLEAWRTSCPRLPVWEDAQARGFIDHLRDEAGVTRVAVSARGRAHLCAHRGRSGSR